jgi:hypothetical protein
MSFFLAAISSVEKLSRDSVPIYSIRSSSTFILAILPYEENRPGSGAKLNEPASFADA